MVINILLLFAYKEKLYYYADYTFHALVLNIFLPNVIMSIIIYREIMANNIIAHAVFNSADNSYVHSSDNNFILIP